MELGQYQLQIFVSLVVILGAAFVALICDFLKGNNEQLRELTIELKVRREEEHKRDLLMTPRPFESAPILQTTAPPERAALAESSPKAVETTGADSRPAPVRTRVSTARPRGESKRAIAPEALAAMERGAALAVASPNRASAFARATSMKVEAGKAPPSAASAMGELRSPLEQSASAKAPEKETSNEVTVELMAPRTAPAATNVATMRSRPNWSDLLARRSAGRLEAPSATVAQTCSSSGQAAEVPVPTGFHDGYVLSRLIRSQKPVSGLVVSIGVTAAQENGQADPTAVRHLVQSLIGPQDFACASGPNEYLLIFPQERGAGAQRHLALIAQQLWDFQLNALGEASILFSWGGVEVRGESIENAIASASERMQETRRGRSMVAFETQALKKAV